MSSKTTAKERTRKLLLQASQEFVNGYFEGRATAYFGEYTENYRKLALMLANMSEDAREKRFSKLVGKRPIQDVWDLYGRTYDTIGAPFVAHFAPTALTPDEFVAKCANEEAIGSIAPLKCPCCGGGTFEDNEAFPPHVHEGDSIVFALNCLKCGFPLNVFINYMQ